MFISCDNKSHDWSDYTVVIPAVSVGNVGQLTVDLFISSLWLNKVGYFYDDTFLPVVGNHPYATTDAVKRCNIMTAAEVYEGVQNKIVVVQQRAPIIKGKKAVYIEKLIKWIKDLNFHDIIIVTGSYAHERRDAQLTGSQLRFLMTSSLDAEAGSVLRGNLQWKELEKRVALPGDFVHNNDPEIFIPGGGISKNLFGKCSAEGMKCIVVLRFCSEGDNAMDAVQLATSVNDWKNWVDLNKSEELARDAARGWRIPISWKLQYGSHFDQSLFQ